MDFCRSKVQLWQILNWYALRHAPPLKKFRKTWGYLSTVSNTPKPQVTTCYYEINHCLYFVPCVNWNQRCACLTAFPSDPEIIGGDNLTSGVANTLTCTARAIYPEDVSVEWLKDDEIILEDGKPNTIDGSDGTVTVISTHTFTPTAQEKLVNITCKVILNIYQSSSPIIKTSTKTMDVNHCKYCYFSIFNVAIWRLWCNNQHAVNQSTVFNVLVCCYDLRHHRRNRHIWTTHFECWRNTNFDLQLKGTPTSYCGVDYGGGGSQHPQWEHPYY